jgi:hypothetical protein
MATYSSIIAGLQVFLEAEGDEHGIDAAHDEIWGGCEITNLTTSQLAILEEAGWDWDDEVGAWHLYV